MRPPAHRRRFVHPRRTLSSGRAAAWRVSAPARGGGHDGGESRPALVLCLLLASGYGRGLRMVAGAATISLGEAMGGGVATGFFAGIGLVALLEAQFDLCLAAPLLGCPVDGAEIRRRAHATL